MTPHCVQHVVSSRITIPFGKLFASARYVDEPLLTLTPLYSDCSFLARLACLNPAASVRSEPGSNSSKEDLSGSHAIGPKTDRFMPDPKIRWFWMDPLTRVRNQSRRTDPLLLFSTAVALSKPPTCRQIRFFSAFSRVLAGFFGPPFRVREAQYVRHPTPVKQQFRNALFPR